MSKLSLIIGNGFTIDLINKMGLADSIDVFNLFSKGDELAWPNSPFSGFLTAKNCPSLTSLGLAPGIEHCESSSIFERIITCANFFSYGAKSFDPTKNTVYIKAYFELIEYLRHLFIWYDDIFSKSDWEAKIKDWSWYKFLEKAHAKYECVYIYTLNYDVYLERILTVMGFDFRLAEIDKSGAHKFEIYKPHGSISFVSPLSVSVVPDYSILYQFRDRITSNDIIVNYDSLISKRLINTIIPPYGDSDRANTSWSKTITESFEKKICQSEDVVICGISYWHVDRSELDRVLLSANHDANVLNINPNPRSILNTVLQSRFSNFQYYKDSKILEKIL